jgi:hypothetical protein
VDACHANLAVGVLVKSLKGYIHTLFSGAMVGLVSIHTLEDILLMSIGRFVDLPLFLMYGIGLLVSWVLMGLLINRFFKHKH